MSQLIRHSSINGQVHFTIRESLALKDLHVDVEKIAEDEIRETTRFCQFAGECGIKSEVETLSTGPKSLTVSCTHAEGVDLGCPTPNASHIAAQGIHSKIGRLSLDR
jgi:hypothetical protein